MPLYHAADRGYNLSHPLSGTLLWFPMTAPLLSDHPAWPGISVIIPTWNGFPLLCEYLPAVCGAVAAYPGPWEILLVDDGGTDATAAAIPANFPRVRLIRRERNEGFAAAVTTGLAAAVHPLTLLLNNDIRPEPGFLPPLAEHFRQQRAAGERELFAVVSLQINPGAADDPINPAFDGCRHLCFVRGELHMRPVPIPPDAGEPPRPTALANGGCALFARDRVAALGGFCEVFNPAYFEDAELSVQALRRGWRIVFEPRSVVWHRPNSTTGHRPGLSVLVVRNAFFFQWMLLDSGRLWTEHAACTLVRLAVRTLRGEFAYVRGLAQAIRGIPQIRRQRRTRGREETRSLIQTLAEFRDGEIKR